MNCYLITFYDVKRPFDNNAQLFVTGDYPSNAIDKLFGMYNHTTISIIDIKPVGAK